MRVMTKKPFEEPVIENISGDLDSLQKVVGGYIEVFPLWAWVPEMDGIDVVCFCNEEGKIHELPVNFTVPVGSSLWNAQEALCGGALFTGEIEDPEDGKKSTDISDAQIAMICETFAWKVPT